MTQTNTFTLGQIVYNTNGTSYQILNFAEEYYHLRTIKPIGLKYQEVVAWKMEISRHNPNKVTWEQGHYFNCNENGSIDQYNSQGHLKLASDYFKQKVKKALS